MSARVFQVASFACSLAACAVLQACNGEVGPGSVPGTRTGGLTSTAAGGMGTSTSSGTSGTTGEADSSATSGPTTGTGDSGGTGGSGGNPGGGGSAGADGSSGDALGPCSGTSEECESARYFNEYRTTHLWPSECNNPLVWNDTLGKYAHDWTLQTGANQMHSFGPYGESLGGGDDIGLKDMVFFVSAFDPIGELHCNPDRSFYPSHHCNTMRCDAFTIGVGVLRTGGKLYMTVEFGGKNGSGI